MPRKKEKDQSKLYAYPVRTRVTELVYLRLNAFVGNGDCHSIGEVARRVLSKEKILYVVKDGSMDSIMEELVTIRKELNAIGTNINQITRHFHNSTSADQKLFHALKIGEQYSAIDNNVKILLDKISTLSKQWLQK
jgi:hypothetical protein